MHRVEVRSAHGRTQQSVERDRLGRCRRLEVLTLEGCSLRPDERPPRLHPGSCSQREPKSLT
jgi:hypothetical protein